MIALAFDCDDEIDEMYGYHSSGTGYAYSDAWAMGVGGGEVGSALGGSLEFNFLFSRQDPNLSAYKLLRD